MKKINSTHLKVLKAVYEILKQKEPLDRKKIQNKTGISKQMLSYLINNSYKIDEFINERNKTNV